MNIKQFLLIGLPLTALLWSCGGGEKDLDSKKKELAAHKKELRELEKTITDLEKEIAGLEGGNTDEFIVPVRTVMLERKTFRHAVEVQGLVESDQNVPISSETGGIVKQIHVKEGQKVRRGQLIASMDGAVAGNSAEEIKNALELARVTYEKQKRLWDQNIGSEIQYLEAKNRKDALERQLATSQSQLSKYYLRSPINGTVDAVYVNPGQNISPSTPVVRVVNIEDIKITAAVSERYITSFKKGDTVNIDFPAINYKISEKIEAVGQVVNPDNRTFSMIIRPKNKEKLLKPNLLSIITAFDFVQDSAVVIPTRLVGKENEKEFVYVVEKENGIGKAKKQYIKTGMSYGGETLIETGLKGNEIIISEGQTAVTDGSTVKIIGDNPGELVENTSPEADTIKNEASGK